MIWRKVRAAGCCSLSWNIYYNPNDVAAGRAFASAYVEYTHYVERLYDAAETLAPEQVQKKAPGLAHSH